MKIVIIAFDQFTDLDIFLPWDLLNRVPAKGWSVRIIGEKSHHMSKSGLVIPMHGRLTEANDADVVIFGSGPESRDLCDDPKFLSQFKLNPDRQLIGSMCSGALILGGLGLLKGREATTYPTAKEKLKGFGVSVVDRPFVREGNIATAAGCLAAVDLSTWVIEEKAGRAERDLVLNSVAPVTQKSDAATVCYLEIPATDIEAAGAFYTKVFGWSVTPSHLSEKTYWEFRTGEGQVGQLTGGFDPSLSASESGVLLYLKVADIAATLAQVQAFGGKIVRDKFEIGGGYGFSATFKDPNGNRVGLFSAK